MAENLHLLFLIFQPMLAPCPPGGRAWGTQDNHRGALLLFLLVDVAVPQIIYI